MYDQSDETMQMRVNSYLPCFSYTNSYECFFSAALHSERHIINDVAQGPEGQEQRHAASRQRPLLAEIISIIIKFDRSVNQGGSK